MSGLFLFYYFSNSQAVDPFDPLLQHLVQDKQFSGAVQTSQLHAAAAAAVKVFRVRLNLIF